MKAGITYNRNTEGDNMPFINAKVSVKVSEGKQETIKAKLGKAIELIPGKSENWLMVGFEDQYTLYFKGQQFEKIAFVEVKIFGSADKKTYDQLTSTICSILNEELSIPADKVYVTYQEIENWGWNGSNF